VGSGLAVLGAAGYEPNVAQSEAVRQAIRAFYALIPSLCNLIAIAVALLYPLSGDMHRKIIAAIDDLKAGRAVADPLEPETVLCWTGKCLHTP
jgi:Na+/melibiose symporter-like transporter